MRRCSYAVIQNNLLDRWVQWYLCPTPILFCCSVNKNQLQPTLLQSLVLSIFVGETGKYYCGRRLVSCQCCDGVCGPTIGCNCASCAQLDLEDKNHYTSSVGRSKSSQHIINSWTWKAKIGLYKKNYHSHKKNRILKLWYYYSQTITKFINWLVLVCGQFWTTSSFRKADLLELILTKRQCLVKLSTNYCELYLNIEWLSYWAVQNLWPETRSMT